DGGHFKYDLGQDFYSVSEVTLNISSTGGGRFDVYIMDWNEYDNAYGGPNASIMSFTAHYVKENITQIDDFVELPGDGVYYYMYWLVIDNRNTPLTPDDATPTGVLTVDLTVTTKNPYYLY
ncbi:MAG: hypothetical protein KAI64_04215, partial [Thermoplasmata archaeon]|nr:hypothetical protein [Thermoplasmata archaeon]